MVPVSQLDLRLREKRWEEVEGLVWASDLICRSALATWRCEERSWKKRRRWKKKKEVRVQAW